VDLGCHKVPFSSETFTSELEIPVMREGRLKGARPSLPTRRGVGLDINRTGFDRRKQNENFDPWPKKFLCAHPSG
jgi:hypothetical protein